MSLLDILEFEAPLSRVEEILQNILGASNEVDPESRVEKLLQNLIEVAYEVDPDSRVELLLDNLLGGHNEVVPMSRVEMLIANALGGSYDVVPQSRVEELLVCLAEQYAVEYKTVSGSVVSISDALEAPMKSLKVSIDPVQDLHGQESPYPAGGGKNLIDYLSCVGMGSRDGTDSIYSDNTSISGTELTINQAFGNNGGILKGVGTFPLSTGEYVTISGKATLAGTSKLVVGISNYDGGGTNNINSNVTVTNGRFSVKLDAKSDYAKTGIFLQPQTSNSTAAVSDVMVALGQTELPYAPYSNICPISGWTGAQVVVSPTQDAQDGTTYPISWETEAGTVYGGTLDVVTGELVVDRASVNLGTLNWSTTGDRFTIATRLEPNPVNRAVWGADNPIAVCSNYKYGNIGNGNGVDKAVGFYNGFLFARDTAYSTAADFKTAMSGVQLVYDLAEPQTYHLTPTEVRTLLGQNNVFADTGDVEVTYLTKKH